MTGGNPPTTMPIRVPMVAGLLVAATLSVADDSVNVSASPADTGERIPLHTVVPKYPESARRARVEGEVEVCFNVDRRGRTHRVSVRRSSNKAFEKPAKNAVRASTYRPLAEGRELSGIKTCRTFRFFLNPVAIEIP